MKTPTLESLHCIWCQGPLERGLTHWSDPVLWCAACQRGWLPGTRGFDELLERQGEGPDRQPDLWAWLETSPKTSSKTFPKTELSPG